MAVLLIVAYDFKGGNGPLLPGEVCQCSLHSEEIVKIVICFTHYMKTTSGRSST